MSPAYLEQHVLRLQSPVYDLKWILIVAACLLFPPAVASRAGSALEAALSERLCILSPRHQRNITELPTAVGCCHHRWFILCLQLHIFVLHFILSQGQDAIRLFDIQPEGTHTHRPTGFIPWSVCRLPVDILKQDGYLLLNDTCISNSLLHRKNNALLLQDFVIWFGLLLLYWISVVISGLNVL